MISGECSNEQIPCCSFKQWYWLCGLRCSFEHSDNREKLALGEPFSLSNKSVATNNIALVIAD